MNVTICSRKAAEELLRTDTLSRTAASPSLPTTAITPTKWCITRSWTHWKNKARQRNSLHSAVVMSAKQCVNYRLIFTYMWV